MKNIIKIEVDCAHLGDFFSNDDKMYLREFCKILQKKLENAYEVIAITDSYNGARAWLDENGEKIEISENIWNESLAEMCKY